MVGYQEVLCWLHQGEVLQRVSQLVAKVNEMSVSYFRAEKVMFPKTTSPGISPGRTLTPSHWHRRQWRSGCRFGTLSGKRDRDRRRCIVWRWREHACSRAGLSTSICISYNVGERTTSCWHWGSYSAEVCDPRKSLGVTSWVSTYT
jgi:hypothetical protein